MSGYYFSVLVILILHRFDLALHASLLMVYRYSMFLLVFKKKLKIKKNCLENAGNFIFSFLACQILHVFLPDISVHCALIDCAFI
jgi:hypothetical protein